MALTVVEKKKTLDYIKRHQLGNMFYNDMCISLNTKNKLCRSDFIDFFTDYLLKNLEMKSVTSLNDKLAGCISSLLDLARKYGESINIELIAKLRTLKEKYESYKEDLKANNQESDELTKYIELISENAEKLYSSIDNASKLESFIAEKRELISQIEALRIELASITKLNEKNEKKVRSQTRTISTQKHTISKMSKEAEIVSSKLSTERKNSEKLKSRIASLNEKISSLEAKIIELTNASESLSEEKSCISQSLLEAQEEIVRLKALLEEKEQIITVYENREAKRFLEIQELKTKKMNEDIKAVILSTISKGSSTIGDIIYYLNLNGFCLSRREINEYLQEIKKTIQISISDEKELDEYSIERPTIETNRIFNIPLLSGTKCFDILVVSDFHLSELDTDTLRSLENINNYCNQNNIGVILNGGDFFSFKSYSKSRRHIGLSNWQQIVENAIENYPYNEDLIHLVLGGNHDCESLTGGIDAIAALAKERADFAYLGYTHARITFNGSRSTLNSISINHPNTRYDAFAGTSSYSTEQLKSTLDSFFIRNGEKRDTYLDLVGHIHKSGLDTENGICIIPSFFKDRVQNGAWHLKVYFDELGNINNIVLIPLIKTNKLQMVTEINYEKKLMKAK